MNVRHITTTANNLDNISIVDGQIIYLSDTGNIYFDYNGSRVDMGKTYNDTELKNAITSLTEEVTTNSEDITDLEENKVDKEDGKGLSTNDFTDSEKSKLASLENYDDTELKNDITNLQNNKQDTLVSGESIKTVNNESLLGSGNVEIESGTVFTTDEKTTFLSSNNVLTAIGKQGTGTDAELFNSASEASGEASHAEGDGTIASGEDSHSEGSGTTASGMCSHAEGIETVASELFSHAEGNCTIAEGASSHAEGIETAASAEGSHVEGNCTATNGEFSHAEGDKTTTNASYSHAEGSSTRANGVASHVEGRGTIATGEGSHAEGKYNVEDTTNVYAHILGGGTSSSNRKNIHTVDWSGNAYYAGTVKASDPVEDDDLVTKSYLDTAGIGGLSSSNTSISTSLPENL